jgi:hypothetical protein
MLTSAAVCRRDRRVDVFGGAVSPVAGSVVGSVETFALGIGVSVVVCVFVFVERFELFPVGAVLLFCVGVLVLEF